MRSLMPKQPVFFALLHEVNVISNDSVALLGQLSKDFKDLQGYSKKAKELEKKGDDKTYEIVDRLNRTFITPLDREDIYLLAQELDDVIDVIENFIHAICLYQIESPMPALVSYIPLIESSAACLEGLLTSLEKLKHDDKVIKLKQTIRHNKHLCDGIYDQAITELFRIGGKDPMTAIKLKDLLEMLHHLMNKYKQLADLIEGIIVKSS